MSTENKMSLFLSAAAAFIIAAVLLLLYLAGTDVQLWMAALIPLPVFVIFFFGCRMLVKSTVKSRINPLHNTVQDPGDSGAGKKRQPDHPGIISGAGKKRQADHPGIISGAEEEVTELKKLKGLENYRKEFLGNVYHELKTPIFNLQGYILTLIEGGLDDPEINKLYLERTEQNINRMINIVEDLESISGLESGALNLRMETFSIKRTLREVFEANEMRARKFNVKLEAGKLKDSRSMVRGDRKRIFQVLNNLVMNSINYGVKNGKTTVNFSESGKKLLIEVRDDGIGISREELPRIFERFYRVDKSRSRNSGGTGLGLAIVKHIIEAHKQSIKVNSVPGKGSSFIFSLDKG